MRGSIPYKYCIFAVWIHPSLGNAMALKNEIFYPFLKVSFNYPVREELFKSFSLFFTHHKHFLFTKSKIIGWNCRLSYRQDFSQISWVPVTSSRDTIKFQKIYEDTHRRLCSAQFFVAVQDANTKTQNHGPLFIWPYEIFTPIGETHLFDLIFNSRISKLWIQFKVTKCSLKSLNYNKTRKLCIKNLF